MTLPLEFKNRINPFEESYFYEVEILKVVSEVIFFRKSKTKSSFGALL
jgi:hypothetical protein